MLAVARTFLALASTWRVRVRMPDGSVISPDRFPFEPDILAIRERDLLAPVPVARFAKAVALVAEGKDGDRAAVVAEWLGTSVVRGSSLHDPYSAAIRFCRALRSAPGPAILVVDGPVGPLGVAKPGIGAIAGHSGRAIRAVAVDARPRITLFYLWSKMIIPIPFARVTFAVSEPLTVSSTERSSVDRAAAEVTKMLESCAGRAGEAASKAARALSAQRQVAR